MTVALFLEDSASSPVSADARPACLCLSYESNRQDARLPRQTRCLSSASLREFYLSGLIAPQKQGKFLRLVVGVPMVLA